MPAFETPDEQTMIMIIWRSCDFATHSPLSQPYISVL